MELLLIFISLFGSLSVLTSLASALRSKGPSTRIFGGVKATNEDYPPIISLSFYMTQKELESNHNIPALVEGGHWHFCGGTIIHRQWVLTAAHCLTNQTKRLWRLRVRVGFSDISNDKPLEPGEANLKVEKYILHPDYDKRYWLSDDVALVKVNGSFEDGRIARVQTVDNDLGGIQATALGWGMTESKKSPYLMKVTEEICRGEDWIKDYELGHLETGLVKKELICHGKKSGRGICTGDSGGPLVVGPKKTLVGVSSSLHAASPCGTGGYFQKVSNHIAWIEKTMGDKVNKYLSCSIRSECSLATSGVGGGCANLDWLKQIFSMFRLLLFLVEQTIKHLL